MSARYSAAMCYLIIGLCLLAAWYGFLFVTNTSGVLPSDYLAWALLSEHPDRPLFVWLAIAPVLCVGLALYYMVARRLGTTAAVVLFAIGALHGAGAIWFFPTRYAAFCLVPLYFAYQTWSEAAALPKTGRIT